MTRYTGSCHCGAVSFAVEVDISELYMCDCSLCRRRNALMALAPEAALVITDGEDVLTLYQWNTGVAKHYFCRVCGIYPFHKKRSTPDHYAINVLCLDNFDEAAFSVRRAEGKGMSLEPGARAEWPGPRG